MSTVKKIHKTLAQRLGENVKARRDVLNMPQRVLADKLKMTQGYVSQIEKGMREPSLTVLGQLAEALDVPIGWLLKGDQP